MKCISCESNINPQWTHAIDMNVCPFCGKHIMEEHLKNLLATLRETMVALQSYPDQLNDWLLSNYSYIKTDSPNLANYVPQEMLKQAKREDELQDFIRRKEAQGKKEIIKVKTDTGEEDVIVEKIQSEEETNEFFKRAEVIPKHARPQNPNASPTFQSPTEKTEYLKKMAQQIKKAGSQGLSVSGGVTSAIGIPADMLDEADPEAVAELEHIISGGEIASSVDSDLDDDLPGGDFILQANLAAKSKQGSSSDGGYNPKDAAALQKMQAKFNQSRKNISTGAKGSFSRS